MLNPKSRVGIAGCGGIGSNVAVHLIRSGINRLTLVDFDRIEASNLNRQFFFHDQIGSQKAQTLKHNLLRIDPKADLEAKSLLLDRNNLIETFEDCELIVEGFDNADSKVMLIEVFANTDIPIISASGLAGLDLGKIHRKDLGNNLTIFGDFKSDVATHRLFSPKVFMVTAMMANEILVRMGLQEDL